MFIKRIPLALSESKGLKGVKGTRGSGTQVAGGKEPRLGIPLEPRVEAVQGHKPPVIVPVREHHEDGSNNLQEEYVGATVSDETGVFTFLRSQNEVFNLQEIGELPANFRHLCFGGGIGEFISRDFCRAGGEECLRQPFLVVKVGVAVGKNVFVGKTLRHDALRLNENG